MTVKTVRLEPFKRIVDLDSTIGGSNCQELGTWIKLHFNHQLILRFHGVQTFHFAKRRDIKLSLGKWHFINSHQMISVRRRQNPLICAQSKSANILV